MIFFNFSIIIKLYIYNIEELQTKLYLQVIVEYGTYLLKRSTMWTVAGQMDFHIFSWLAAI